MGYVGLYFRCKVVSRPPIRVVEQDLAGLVVRDAGFVAETEEGRRSVATCRGEHEAVYCEHADNRTQSLVVNAFASPQKLVYFRMMPW